MTRAASPKDPADEVQTSILRFASLACACFALCDKDVDRQIFQFVDWLRSEFELRPANGKDKIERLSCHYLRKAELPDLVRALGQSNSAEYYDSCKLHSVLYHTVWYRMR